MHRVVVWRTVTYRDGARNSQQLSHRTTRPGRGPHTFEIHAYGITLCAYRSGAVISSNSCEQSAVWQESGHWLLGCLFHLIPQMLVHVSYENARTELMITEECRWRHFNGPVARHCCTV